MRDPIGDYSRKYIKLRHFQITATKNAALVSAVYSCNHPHQMLLSAQQQQIVLQQCAAYVIIVSFLTQTSPPMSTLILFNLKVKISQLIYAVILFRPVISLTFSLKI